MTVTTWTRQSQENRKNREKKKKARSKSMRKNKLFLLWFYWERFFSLPYWYGVVIVCFFPVLAYASWLAFIKGQTKSTKRCVEIELKTFCIDGIRKRILIWMEYYTLHAHHGILHHCHLEYIHFSIMFHLPLT